MNNQSNFDRKKILNGEVHNWYKITLGFSDQLVSMILDKFEFQSGDWVLDPFCGSGTTLVECKKRGIDTIGIDANPSSYFASRVKTNWELDGSQLKFLLSDLGKYYASFLDNIYAIEQDVTYKYLTDSGMIKEVDQSKAFKKSIGDKISNKNSRYSK